MIWLEFLVVDFIGKDRSDFIHSLAKSLEGENYKMRSMRSHTLSLADSQELQEETKDGDLDPVMKAFWDPQKSKYATHESDYWEFELDGEVRIQFWHMPTKLLTKEGLSSDYIDGYVDSFCEWAKYYIYVIPIQKPDLFPQVNAVVNAMKAKRKNYDVPTLFIIADNPQPDFDDQILRSNLDLPKQCLIQEANILKPNSVEKVLAKFMNFILDMMERDNDTASSDAEM